MCKCKRHLYLSVIAFILAGVANYEGSPHSFDRKISRKQTLYTLYTACFVHTRFCQARSHASELKIYHEIMYPFVKINASINLNDRNFKKKKKKRIEIRWKKKKRKQKKNDCVCCKGRRFFARKRVMLREIRLVTDIYCINHRRATITS